MAGMAQAQVVYTSATNGSGPGIEINGSLFSGIKFWFAQRCPMRSHFITQVTNNGGEVVPLEKNADIKVVDHKRKDIPPGSYSFTFVDQSLRNGRLEKLEDHVASPSVSVHREVGSTTLQPRSTRTPFTAEDDRVLWEWVLGHEQRGGKILGNEIYKHLASMNPRHTWQSWRDRWVKYLSGRERSNNAENGSPATQSDQPPNVTEGQPSSEPDRQLAHAPILESGNPFTPGEAQILLDEAASFSEVPMQEQEEAWRKWAEEHPSHTSEQWQSFFDNAILKNYEKPKVANGSITILQSIIDRPGVTPTDTATPDTARIPPSSGNDAAVQSHIHSSANDPRPVESPSFQPESPTLQSYSINSQCKADDSPTGTGKDDSQTRARLSEILSPSEGALKRKKDQIELREDVDENTQNKRVRRKSSPEQDRENPVGSKEALSGSDAVALSEGVGAAEPAPLRDRGSEDSDSTELPELQSLFNAQEHKSTLGVKSVAQAAPVDDGSVEESYTGDSPHDEEQAPSNEKGTQAILAEDTQIPDLGLADPDGGWDSLIASPLAELHSSPRSAQVDPAEEKAELDEWIDARIEAGFSEGDILLSLKCSSMDTQLAQIALHSLAQGRGIPVNVRGIWTPEEDELLDGGNSRKIRALEEKHGTEAFNARWDFMGHYRSDL